MEYWEIDKADHRAAKEMCSVSTFDLLNCEALLY